MYYLFSKYTFKGWQKLNFKVLPSMRRGFHNPLASHTHLYETKHNGLKVLIAVIIAALLIGGIIVNKNRTDLVESEDYIEYVEE